MSLGAKLARLYLSWDLYGGRIRGVLAAMLALFLLGFALPVMCMGNSQDAACQKHCKKESFEMSEVRRSTPGWGVARTCYCWNKSDTTEAFTYYDFIDFGEPN